MRHFTKLSLVIALVGASAAFVACGDDDNIVRERIEAGVGDAASEGSVEGGPGTLACGIAVPPTYVSPSFAVNAKAELDLEARFRELDARMRAAEDAGAAVVTAAELNAIFTAGAPSLRSVATAAAQSTVDTYITQFAEAVGKTWTPADAEAEGGASAGGKYEGTSNVSRTGVDLRVAIQNDLLAGAFYSYALGLAGGPITEATIDQLMAVFGATPQLANRTDGDAGDAADELVAAYASQRDNKAPSTLGPYRKVAGALRVAKAAAAGGEKCRADLDAALAVYFREWEKATYLTVIYSLNAAANGAVASPQRGPQALRDYGAALGLIQSFRGIPQDRRTITDAQIDGLLQRVGAASPYQLVTRTSERVVAFNTAYQDVGAIFGLTQTEIEEAKKVY